MQFLLRRIILTIPVLLGVTLLTFAIVKLTPGDPVILMLGNSATPERVAEVRAQLGLDDPLLTQYGRYLSRVMAGDLGTSIRSKRPVLDEIMERLPGTLELAAGALLVATLTGIPFGVWAAASRRRWPGPVLMSITIVGMSLPSFWLAVIALIVFGVNLRWVSVTGGDTLSSLVLAALCLGIGEAAVLARLTCSSMREVLLADYIRTASAKGLARPAILWRHALRNALIPLLTQLGLLFGSLMGGSLFIESVFARSGLGRYAINAISARDLPQIQGMVLFAAVIYVIVNLLVDLAYTWADPRLRYA
ncbi:MAG: ABC transporter permease [Anaerolineae bacterium]|nr:ABC transporter permease [Anaerolineae bacterium]